MRATAARQAHGLTGVRVLHKTFDILEALKQSPAGVGLADLTRSVKMPKATVYRILTTLEARGYLDRHEDGSYRMARKLFDLQRPVPIEQMLSQAAHPLMERLAEACGETVNLGILDAGEVVVIDTVESSQAVRMSSKVGNRRYLHATALGKCFLAGLPQREVLRLVRLKGLPRLTAHTLSAKAAIMAELQNVRQHGYAIDNQENEIEGRCVGAPIHGPSGRVMAARSISGPVFRMSVARAHALVDDLRRTCTAISAAIDP